MQYFQINKLQNDFIDFLRKNDVDIVPLITKSDLDKTGVKPKVFLQFVQNRWIAPLKMEVVFNVYIVHKTLGGTGDHSIIDIMDRIRPLLASARVEYEPYVSKRNYVKIEDESFAETNSMAFIYVIRFSIEASIFKERK